MSIAGPDSPRSPSVYSVAERVAKCVHVREAAAECATFLLSSSATLSGVTYYSVDDPTITCGYMCTTVGDGRVDDEMWICIWCSELDRREPVQRGMSCQ